MPLAENIKLYREKAKLSQRMLAEETGLTDAYISMLETTCRDNPSYSVIKRLASALNCSTSDLMSDDPYTA